MHRFITLIVLFTWSGLAVADNKQLFACQYVASAGLDWEKGGWKSTQFDPGSPFVLVIEGGTLTRESVAAAFRLEFPTFVECRGNIDGNITCSDTVGSYLFFSYYNAIGGVANLYGASQSGKSRDPLSVAPFTCQKF